MKELIEKMERDAEEYGYLHNEDCSCMMEDPDACDCDNLKIAKVIARKHMEAVNEWWVLMCKQEKGGKPLSKLEATHLVAKMRGTNRKP